MAFYTYFLSISLFSWHSFSNNNAFLFNVDLTESKARLNKSGTIEFGKNISDILLLQDWYNTDNGDIVLLENEKGTAVSGVSNSISEHNIYQEISQYDSFSNSG